MKQEKSVTLILPLSLHEKLESLELSKQKALTAIFEDIRKDIKKGKVSDPEPTKSLTIRMDLKDYEELRAWVSSTGKTLTALVREKIEKL
jgi:predicted DNA-binding protein